MTGFCTVIKSSFRIVNYELILPHGLPTRIGLCPDGRPAGNGLRAAEATAALFNRLHPYIIGVVSLTLFPEAPLAADVAAGRFVEAGERERLEELRAFIAALTVPATLMGHTVSNTVPLLGRLPEDRARLLRELDDALARFDESDLAAYRRGIVHL